jgi:hypothetical protein
MRENRRGFEPQGSMTILLSAAMFKSTFVRELRTILK